MTRHLEVRPVTPSDLDDIFRLSFEGDNWISWRFRGAAIGPQEFAARIWQADIGTQAIARTRSNGHPVAHLICYENRGHTAKFGIVAAPEYHRTGMPMEAAGCFLDFLFLNWPFRKLYIEMVRPVWDVQLRLREYFEVEGVLKEHEFLGGEYVDLILAACNRERFYERSAEVRALWLGGLMESAVLLGRSSRGGVGPIGVIADDAVQ